MLMDPSGPSAGNVYLVAVRDRVVLQDLSDTVAEFDRHAVVLAHPTCDGVFEALRSCDRLKLAFVEAGPRCLTRLKVDVAVSERGGKLILLGDEAEMESESCDRTGIRWRVLKRPFTTQAVLREMASAIGP